MASVTNMIQKLASAKSPLVDYERHRGVCLSRTGRKRALEIIRHHRLIETFLYEVLNYPIEKIHDEAERLDTSLRGLRSARPTADWIGKKRLYYSARTLTGRRFACSTRLRIRSDFGVTSTSSSSAMNSMHCSSVSCL